jgi:hypothetical protein
MQSLCKYFIQTASDSESLGLLGEGGDIKKEKTWDEDREGERIVWSCWVNS